MKEDTHIHRNQCTSDRANSFKFYLYVNTLLHIRMMPIWTRTIVSVFK